MTTENIIKYTYWTGIFKKIKESSEGINGRYLRIFYKLRIYHPLTWILFILIYIYNIIYYDIRILFDIVIELKNHKIEIVNI